MEVAPCRQRPGFASRPTAAPKPTGQAVVTINGRDLYLGKWNTAASRGEYDRLIAEFLANGRQALNDSDRTVIEVLTAYQKFAENYYRIVLRDVQRVPYEVHYRNDGSIAA